MPRPSQQLKKALIPLGLMAALACNRLINVLAPDNVVWQMHDVTQALALTLALAWALQEMPYKHLRYKCIAAAFFGMAATDFIGVSASYLLAPLPTYYNFQLLAQVLVGAGMFALYWLRSYEKPSDALGPENMYLLRKRPDSATGVLLALSGLYGADGGYAIYSNGRLYRFRKGIFGVDDINEYSTAQRSRLLKQYHIQRGRIPSVRALNDIRGMLGSKWSLFNNCTKLRRIWRQNNV